VTNNCFSSITHAAKIKAAAFLNWWEWVLQIKKMHKNVSSARLEAIDKAVNAMLEKAVVRKATDIHIEPRERTIVVRFRVDGLLEEVAKLPLPALDELADNLKMRAGLDPDETRSPQSGDFAFSSDQYDVSLQLSTMPTISGEKIVIHVSPHLSEPATLESLGFWGRMLQNIEYAVAEPHGLAVVASPNRTGTSLTLIGLVHLLSNPALNIATLEDSIEQRMPGVSQTQIDEVTGVNFSSGLVALLKQDPNVVMVSNMHESETVKVALDASLGGHLLLGGLHTGSAAQAVTQLLHMGSEPFLVATALKIAIGQRFVRRLCPVCREAYKPDANTGKVIKRLLKTSGVNSVKQLHEFELQALSEGIGGSEANSLGTTAAGITRLWRAKPDGCPRCHFTGFNGRIGVCEVLVNSDAMKKLVASMPTASAIHELAISEGMIPLQCDAFIKCLRGLTSMEEILILAN
jgi:type II secretory ATPase GspE/PulE/Tfp pilus assembly ATPase PilB-like protein